MTLTLYNTLTRRKERFEPIDPNNVRLYVCGPTVYDFAHIGNARPVIVFDVLFRLLRHLYGADHVTYARNITDVDDKINARAAEQYPGLPLNEAIRKVTEETGKQFHADIAALGVLPPTVEPRATEHIAEMRAMIERLVGNGHAYVAQDHVLFDVSSMPDYGRLANRSLEEMEAGARVEVAPYKKGAMDFVLWKPSKPGEPGWESPAGIAAKGRPGWHIECSAMADKWLWQAAEGSLSAAGLAHPHVFDIHGGGIDLVFPHHENEIAQSRCAHGTPAMANVWMHNGFLQVEGQKMSKSLGNFVTINELLASEKFGGRRWNGDVVRFAMLQTHYTKPMDWTVSVLEQSEKRLARWKAFAASRSARKLNKELRNEVLSRLCDDLNTPGAFSLIDEACRSGSDDERDRHTVFRLLTLLGFRNLETPVSKAAQKLSVVAGNLRKFGEQSGLTKELRASLHNGNNQQKSVVSLIAHLGAASDLREFLWNTLSEYPVKQGQRVWLYSLPLQKRDDHKDLSIDYLATMIRVAVSALSHLQLNEWEHLADNVRRSPYFLSGRPKPETVLFIALNIVGELRRDLKDILSTSPTHLHLDKLWKRISEEIVPKVSELEQHVQLLIAARNAARKAKDFKEADRIRDELSAMGIQLKDAKNPATGEIETTWEVRASGTTEGKR